MVAWNCGVQRTRTFIKGESNVNVDKVGNNLLPVAYI